MPPLTAMLDSPPLTAALTAPFASAPPWAIEEPANAKTETIASVNDRKKSDISSGPRHAFVRVRCFVCMIGASHQGARLYVNEPQIEGNGFQLLEFVRMVVARDRRMALGRTQILANRQDATSHLAEI